MRYPLMLAICLTLLGCGGGPVDSTGESRPVTESAEAPKAVLDHVILAVPDLEAGAADFERTAGVTPITGGVEPSLELVIEYPGGDVTYRGEGPLESLG
jgi:hypothetical protein